MTRRYQQRKDIPTLEVELMEKVAGLDFQQIRQMDIKTFLKHCRICKKIVEDKANNKK